MTKAIVNKMHDKYVSEFLDKIDVNIRVNNRDKIFARIYEIFDAYSRVYRYYMIHDEMQIKYANHKMNYIRRMSKNTNSRILVTTRTRLDLGDLAEKFGQNEPLTDKEKRALLKPRV